MAGDDNVKFNFEVETKAAITALDNLTKSLKNTLSTMDKSGKSASTAEKALSSVEKAVSGKGFAAFGKIGQGLSKEFASLGQNVLSNIPVLGKYSSALSGISGGAGTAIVALGGVAVAVAGVTAGMAAFFALGKRGASLQPAISAFGNIIGAAGDSTQILQGLREQTRGTVSDFELMRLSVLSLQGTSESFRSAVAPQLGTIIDLTSRVAQATGQSAEVVREKFFLGLRRQSKLLLDDVGVVVDKTSAEFKKLSQQIGDEAAYAQMAIDDLIRVGAELGEVNKVQESLIRMQVFFSNFIDKLSLAIQPAFAPVAEIISKITGALTYLSSFVFPVIQAGAKVVGAVLTAAFRIPAAIIQTVFGPALDAIGTTLPYIAAIAIMTADAITGAINGAQVAIIAVVQGLSNAVSSALSFLGISRDKILGDTNISLTEIGTTLARGGGQIIGAFAAGMARGATKVVNVVTKIAQIVADFLVGFSPPRTGPLSNIDIGGMNTIAAWADGMLKGFVNPVDKIAEEVNARLGNIATFSISQVDAKLQALDQAIRPFRENLDIAKSDFEAMAGFADPVLKALERQQQKALKGFAAGEVDADRVQQLDRQIQQFNELKDLVESRSDQAQIDLAVAEARQAQERALLKIQKERLGGTVSAGAGGAEKADKDAAAKKAGGGGGASEAAGGGGGFKPGKAPDLLANESINKAREKINAFGDAVGGAFGDGFSDATSEAFGDFDVARGGLDAQLARIRGADPVQKIKDKFSGLENFLDNPLGTIQRKIDEVFGIDGSILKTIGEIDLLGALTGVFDGAANGITESSVSGLKTRISELVRSVFNIDTGISSELTDKIEATVKSGFSGASLTIANLAGDANVKSVKNRIQNLLSGLPSSLDLSDTVSNLSEKISNTVKSGFTSAQELVSGILGDDSFLSVQNEIKNVTKGLFENLPSLDINIDTILQPIRDFVGGFNEALGKFDFGLIEDAKGAVSWIADKLGVDSLFGDSGATEVKDALSNLSSELVGQGIELQFTLPPGLQLSPENQEMLRALGRSFTGFIVEGMTGEEAKLTLAMGFTTLLTNITLTLTTFSDNVSSILARIKDDFYAVFASPDGAIQKLGVYLEDAIGVAETALTNFANDGIGNALTNLGRGLATHLGQPFADAVNGILDGIANAINSFIGSANKVLSIIGKHIEPFEPPNFTFPVVGAATGALGLKGTFMAGENGAELITTKKPATVFPARATRTLQQILAKPAPMMLPNQVTNNTTNNNQRSMNNNINVNNTSDALLMMRQLEASYR